MRNRPQVLTNYVKDQIQAALLTHRTKASEEAYHAVRGQFALDVYELVYPKDVRKKMAALPPGFMGTKKNFRANIAGETADLWLLEERPFSQAHLSRYNTLITFVGGTPIAERWILLKAQGEAHDELVKQVTVTARAALNSVRTVKKLIEVWPEVAPFVPTYAKTEPARLLPVIKINELNTLLKLPKELSKPVPKGTPA